MPGHLQYLEDAVQAQVHGKPIDANLSLQTCQRYRAGVEESSGYSKVLVDMWE